MPRVPKKGPGGSVQGTVAGRPQAIGYFVLEIRLFNYKICYDGVFSV